MMKKSMVPVEGIKGLKLIIENVKKEFDGTEEINESLK